MLQIPLHEFKYQKRVAFAHALSKAWNLLLSWQLEHTTAHFLPPVPLSAQKLAQRGFNQNWEIAKRIQCGRQIQKSPYLIYFSAIIIRDTKRAALLATDN
ncbi:hypothetical protein [Polynucleobacter necessarius]|uniref:hypothetical protein n=1 Tax=Polynucleobacter necessarius TaxID=576610 RepID=UPI0013B04D9D|nr:hypothetical protein [Polynucleobacter necessarius]